jgi:antitoxin (DNA-binding transcriptional repressor) of toxin-antitoxin stability system
VKTIALEESGPQICQLESSAETEPVVLTRAGKPVACVFGLRQYDAEDFEYITDPAFWKMIRERRSDDSDLVPLEEVEARLAEQERAEQAQSNKEGIR